jgi:hypothetical protein
VVPAIVVKHVHQCVPHLARRFQRVRVVPLREHLPALPSSSIEPPRDSNREPLHRARKRALVSSFHNQVQVIRLHRKLNQPSPQPSLR